MTFCGNCGSDNPGENRFCFNCGAELIPVPVEPSAEPTPAPAQEVERIGPYNPPHANHYAQVVPVQQQQYQQPYGQAPYMQQPYNQPYQQQYSPATMLQSYQSPYGQYYQVPGRSTGMFYLNGSPNNNIKLRYVGMLLSVSAFILTVAALFAINVVDGKSLFMFGLDKDGQVMILVFSIITLIVGLASLLIPMFTIVSGVCLIMTAALPKISKSLADSVDGTGFVLVIVLGVLAMALGIAASMVMGKYVRSNVRNVSMFQCNLFTWTGIRGEHRTTSFERPKY